MTGTKKIDTSMRAGRIYYVGHYSNLQARYVPIGQETSVPAAYSGESFGWHQFKVPSHGITVYAKQVGAACTAYLDEETLAGLGALSK